MEAKRFALRTAQGSLDKIHQSNLQLPLLVDPAVKNIQSGTGCQH
jgi:hypothetical protein